MLQLPSGKSFTFVRPLGNLTFHGGKIEPCPANTKLVVMVVVIIPATDSTDKGKASLTVRVRITYSEETQGTRFTFRQNGFKSVEQ